MKWQAARAANDTTETPPAPAPTTEVGAYQPDNDNVGESRQDLLKYPYLSLFTTKSQNADELQEWINTWVYDKCASIGKEIVVIPVRVANYLEEKTEFGSGDIPEKWATLKEAIKSGKPWQDAAEIRMLIEFPDGKEDSRAELIGGKRYVPAVYTVRRSSLGVYRTMRTDYDGWLGKGENGATYGKRYANGQYLLGIKKVVGQAGPYSAPTIKAHGYVPAAIRAEIKERFGF